MILKFNAVTLFVLLMAFLAPTSSQAMVAVELTTNQRNIDTSEHIKKEPKKVKKIPWWKILKYGLLPALQVVTFLLVLTTALAGSELIGLLFFNVAIFLASVTMLKKKKPMIKASIIISYLTVLLNLAVRWWMKKLED